MKILHLYHDLMNLYGDYANVSALSKILKANSIDFEVDRRSIYDSVVLGDYDFVFIGAGTEENQKIALAHLRNMKEAVEEYVSGGKLFLATGNAAEMFGEKIVTPSGEFEGLGIFTYTTVQQNEQRIAEDGIFLFEDKEIVGFVNKCGWMTGVDTPLFRVEKGFGNEENGKTEGVRKNNFFGTQLTGPVLVKNPHFLRYIASLLTGKDMSDEEFYFEKAGFEITLNKLRDRR